MGKILNCFKILCTLWVILAFSILCCRQIRADQDKASDEQTFDLSIEASVPEEICFRNETGTVPVRVSVTGTDISEVTLVKMTCLGSTGSSFITLAQQTAAADDGSISADFMMTGMTIASAGTVSIPVRVELIDNSGMMLLKKVVTLQTRVSPYSVLAAVLSSDEALPDLTAGALRSLFSGDMYMPQSMIRAEALSDTQKLIEYRNLYRLLIVDRPLNDAEAEDAKTWICSGGYALITANSDFLQEEEVKKKSALSFGSGYYLICDDVPVAGEMLSNCIRTLCGDSIYDFYQEPDQQVPVYPNDLTAYDAFSPVMHIWPYRILLLAFVLISGPGFYFILRKRDRLEQLWIWIPIAALVFSAVLFAAGRTSRFTKPFVRYFTLMNLTDQGSDEKTVFSVTSPGKEPAVLSVTNPSAADLFETIDMHAASGEIAEARLNGDEETIVLFQREGRTDIMTDPEGVFSNQYFKAHQFVKAGSDKKGFNADITYDKGRIRGSVSNETGMDLEGVFAGCNSIYIEIGALAAGETKSFDMDSKDCFFVIDQLDNEAFCQDIAAQISVPNQQALVTQIGEMLSQEYTFAVDQCFIGGFTTGQAPVMEGISPDFIKGLTFVMASADEWHAGDGRKAEITVAGAYEHPDEEILTESSETDSPVYYDYSDTPQEYIYQFGMDYQPDHIIWLNPEEGAVCEWYNLRTGEYDRMFEDTAAVEGRAISDYLNKDHVLKIRYQGNVSYMVPVFSSFGGEAND